MFYDSTVGDRNWAESIKNYLKDLKINSGNIDSNLNRIANALERMSNTTVNTELNFVKNDMDIEQGIYQKIQQRKDIKDILDIVREGIWNSSIFVKKEAVVINECDSAIIQQKFREHHDLTTPDYWQLVNLINEYIDTHQFSEPHVIDVAFYNPSMPNGFDETEFDDVKTLKELGELWIQFANENHIPASWVTDYDIVG